MHKNYSKLLFSVFMRFCLFILFLDSMKSWNEWNHMVFVFLWLISLDLQGPSMLSQMAKLHSWLCLSSIPVYVCMCMCGVVWCVSRHRNSVVEGSWKDNLKNQRTSLLQCEGMFVCAEWALDGTNRPLPNCVDVDLRSQGMHSCFLEANRHRKRANSLLHFTDQRESKVCPHHQM